jgi:zinc/manganese transport system ATP-binding protein
MSAAAIRLDDLTLGYDRHPAVHHLSGSFGPGSLTAIVGPNGAGKTTLLKAIVGLLRPLAGRIDLGAIRRAEIAYLPQQADIDRSFPISVLDMVQLGHWGRIGVFGRISPAMRAAAGQALEAVGLTSFEQRPIGSLSAGQFQRALFARTLLQDCPVILLDEPSPPSMRTPRRTCSACIAGMASGARSSSFPTISNRCAAISRRRCWWRASRSVGARRRRC